MQLHQWVFVALWLTVSVYATVRGGTPERITAVLFLVGGIITPLVQNVRADWFRSIEIGILCVDLVMLIALWTSALSSSRFWLMPMTSMQAVQPLGHLARALAPGTVPQVYFAITALMAFPMLALLAWATRRHRRRLQRYGIDPAWTARLPSSYFAGASADECLSRVPK